MLYSWPGYFLSAFLSRRCDGHWVSKDTSRSCLWCLLPWWLLTNWICSPFNMKLPAPRFLCTGSHSCLHSVKRPWVVVRCGIYTRAWCLEWQHLPATAGDSVTQVADSSHEVLEGWGSQFLHARCWLAYRVWFLIYRPYWGWCEGCLLFLPLLSFLCVAVPKPP